MVNQFNVKLRILQSKNGGGYLSSNLYSFFFMSLVWSTRLHVLVLLSKMGWLNVRIDLLEIARAIHVYHECA